MSLKNTRSRLVVGLSLGLLATVLLLCLEAHFRPLAVKGLYFQSYSSETMMQAVSIEDLRDEPLRTLWYLHIQPPAYDAIRALLAYVWRSDDSMNMLWRVDRTLYILWALLYGMTGFVVFWWLSEMTSIKFAAALSLLFLAHPASIFYATFLETTLLSAFLILCFCYLLWRVKEGFYVPVVVLALSFLSLFFTRSIFQWPWLLFLPFSLALMRFPFRRLAVFIAITGIVVGLYTLKQKSLFQLYSTSSFTGINLCNSIGYPDALGKYAKQSVPVQEPGSKKPKVLTRIKKVNGTINFNNEHYLAVNRELLQEYRRQVLQSSPLLLVRSYVTNLKIYLRPSSRLTKHVIVDRLPWRSAYDSLFSFPILPPLLTMAFLFWMTRSNRSTLLDTMGLCLPVAFIAFLCVVFARDENMRYKFFIEPVLFVFLAAQVYGAGKLMIHKGLYNMKKFHATIKYSRIARGLGMSGCRGNKK